jgi:hypothetical protein
MISNFKELNIFFNKSQKSKIFLDFFLRIFSQILGLLNIVILFPLITNIIGNQNKIINLDFLNQFKFSYNTNYLLSILIISLILKELINILSIKISFNLQKIVISEVTKKISSIILKSREKVNIKSTLRILDGEVKICYRFIQFFLNMIFYFFLGIFTFTISVIFEDKITIFFFSSVLFFNLFLIYFYKSKTQKQGIARYKLRRLLNKIILENFDKNLSSDMTEVSKNIFNVTKKFYHSIFSIQFYNQIQLSINLIFFSILIFIFYFTQVNNLKDFIIYFPLLMLILKSVNFLKKMVTSYNNMNYCRQSFIKISKLIKKIK